MLDLIIIGSGPAGLTAAIYAARASLKPLLFAGVVYGGQLMNTTLVENYPGFPDGIMGPDLMMNMLKQAEKFETEIIYDYVEKVDFSDAVKKVYSGDKVFDAKSVIIATGSSPRRLGIPGEDKFYGHGVSTCATCDAAFFKEKIVAVIGGGDSAMEEANFLTKFASKVYLVHRKLEFRASKIMQDRTFNNPKIEILFNTQVKEVIGEEKVTGIKIETTSESGASLSELQIDGMFLAIGHDPVTSFLKDQIELNENGYIKTQDGVHTNEEGVFVAGDVQDYIYRQAVTASGAGCRAALEAQWWLQKNK
jgi:thioredoxin reductase (NADPH)